MNPDTVQELAAYQIQSVKDVDPIPRPSRTVPKISTLSKCTLQARPFPFIVEAMNKGISKNLTNSPTTAIPQRVTQGHDSLLMGPLRVSFEVRAGQLR